MQMQTMMRTLSEPGRSRCAGCSMIGAVACNWLPHVLATMRHVERFHFRSRLGMLCSRSPFLDDEIWTFLWTSFVIVIETGSTVFFGGSGSTWPTWVISSVLRSLRGRCAALLKLSFPKNLGSKSLVLALQGSSPPPSGGVSFLEAA